MVERTFALLHHFKRPAVRRERGATPTTPSSPRPQHPLLPTLQEGPTVIVLRALPVAADEPALVAPDTLANGPGAPHPLTSPDGLSVRVVRGVG